MSGLSLHPSPTADVLIEVLAERARQDTKWGEQNHPDLRPGIGEYFPSEDGRLDLLEVADYYDIPTAGEAKTTTDVKASQGLVSWADIAIEELAEAVEAAALGDELAVRTEVIQLAAVCVQWAQAIDRRGGPEAASERALAQLRQNLGDDSRLAHDIRDGRLPLRQPGEPQSGNPA